MGIAIIYPMGMAGMNSLRRYRTSVLTSVLLIASLFFLTSVMNCVAQRFLDNGDGTVSDTLSGLMWAKNADLAGGQFLYADAQSYVATLTLYNDWRIPSGDDFKSLLVSNQFPPVPAGSPFYGFPSGPCSYWTTDRQIGTGGTLLQYWVLMNSLALVPEGYLRYQWDNYLYPDSTYSYVWPVRGTLQSRIIRITGNLDFGPVTIGSADQLTFTIYNDGNAPLSVTSIDCPPAFSCSWTGTIGAGSSASPSVSFTPSAATAYGGSIAVICNATSA